MGAVRKNLFACVAAWHCWCLVLLQRTDALVDEGGRYHAGGDLMSFAAPSPSEEDRKAAVDLRQQPIEKLFKLLYFELSKEETRPAERTYALDRFLALPESCEEKLLELINEARGVVEEVREYHLNITGIAGLYWMLHKYPEEHSWVWLIAASFQRSLRKVSTWISASEATVMDDRSDCLSPVVRTVLMQSLAQWRRIHSDHIALIWNAVAFGLLGDVTSWRDVDEETLETEAGPGGPPPNVSWSENIIFSNMWVSTVEKWLEVVEKDLIPSILATLARRQRGIPEAHHSKALTSAPPGVTTPFGFLQRQLFGGWPLDKGLARGLLRHILRPSFGAEALPTVADFGAGGGRYSEWLNETGLVHAHAFDATSGVEDMTGGRVVQVDLATEHQLWQDYSWVLCLDVLPHLSDNTATAMLQTISRHATVGVVVTMPQDHSIELEATLNLKYDKAASSALQQSADMPYPAELLFVFTRTGDAV